MSRRRHSPPTAPAHCSRSPQVYNPRNKLQQVFVIVLGRAGEDNRTFRLVDVESTLAGFAGADYDMQVCVGVRGWCCVLHCTTLHCLCCPAECLLPLLPLPLLAGWLAGCRTRSASRRSGRTRRGRWRAKCTKVGLLNGVID